MLFGSTVKRMSTQGIPKTLPAQCGYTAEILVPPLVVEVETGMKRPKQTLRES